MVRKVDATENHDRMPRVEPPESRQRATLDRLLENVTLQDPIRDDQGHVVDLVLDNMNPPTTVM
mgnify:CR=1 FL=1|jgi:hypothetical protein